MEKKDHYFYAIRLPDRVKAELKEFCDRLQVIAPFQRWVHERDYHITLAFLGFAEAEQLQASVQYVKGALAMEASFSVKIEGLGIFGKKDAPRIFWAGLKRNDKLHKVREKVYNACTLAQFQLEKRSFTPHITLARKWQGEEPFASEDLKIFEPIPFIANEVVLYQTHLHKTPKYEAIEVFTLQGIRD